ncbi:PREDICTED: 5-formyltetrahydrofolate cyclo-ligase, mitochondrial-like isoform X2 [Nelumbo nucifera]|uniref:5-formyltetrahydrofolate cyclo-ligase n=1 Tax=Nelumbo nucifera TaxID=4432 RepID=A0A1U8B853_NELNU|nr:PREDICTED: 5-formyltetrahydrofolate cyclo-ligase, mitochondrial-like isoform X2 [Nelumbo nucifera]
MRINGLIQRAKVVLTTQSCTIASSAAQTQIFSCSPSSSRSFILRPPSDARSIFVSMTKDSELDAISQQKRKLRFEIRKLLKGMNPAQRSQEDIAIQNIILESLWFKSSERLCAYINCDALREVDTSKILSSVLCNPAEDGKVQTRKKLYVPRVEDRSSHMRMLNISSLNDLIPNSMNILEPAADNGIGNQLMQASNPVDLFLLPGYAFDRSGRRLGRGGGYYDMFLKRYQGLAAERKWKQSLLVALSYSLQIMDEGVIPVAANDIPVDALVSPDGVIPISPVALERM